MRVSFKVISLLFFLSVFMQPLRAEFNVKQLKKLFTTEQQRNHINMMRKARMTKQHSTGLSPKTHFGRVVVSGYMKRSDGKNVVWVNGTSTLTSNIISDVKVDINKINNHDQVTLFVDGKQLKLKPGQSWTRIKTRDAISVTP